MYSYQTGKFPTRSLRGFQYIMVMVENTSDGIMIEAMQDRTAGEHTRAYEVIMQRLHACKIFPTMHILDNECSGKLKDAIEAKGIRYQLVPQHNHRRNIAEKAV